MPSRETFAYRRALKLRAQKAVDDTDSAIAALVDYARSRNLKIVVLNTLAPSLEDVFLQLVTGSRAG